MLLSSVFIVSLIVLEILTLRYRLQVRPSLIIRHITNILRVVFYYSGMVLGYVVLGIYELYSAIFGIFVVFYNFIVGFNNVFRGFTQEQIRILEQDISNSINNLRTNLYDFLNSFGGFWVNNGINEENGENRESIMQIEHIALVVVVLFIYLF